MSQVSVTLNSAIAASVRKAAVLLPPVASRIEPIRSGPKYPPRLATELIIAIPPAAAAPVRNEVGNDHEMVSHDNAPPATSDSAMSANTGLSPTSASISIPAVTATAEIVA